jgi:hypothetical protein
VRSYVLDMRADVLTGLNVLRLATLQVALLQQSFTTMLSLSAGALAVLHPEERVRLDESEDSEFYSAPRLVHHADEHFRASLTGTRPQQRAHVCRLRHTDIGSASPAVQASMPSCCSPTPVC